ncbi:unnamed protein product [Effrenium voratum]|nr:unnamed protein product [Effrenium voratum]
MAVRAVALLALAHARVLQLDLFGTDAGGCVSSPCRSLSFAIGQVEDGDEIHVSAGTFVGPFNRNLAPGSMGKSNFTVKGAGAGVTVFDLQSQGRFMLLDSSAGLVRVQHLTVARGSCEHLTSGAEFGAGFALLASPAVLEDLHLHDMDCSASTIEPLVWNGGAIYLKDSQALLRRVLATDCVANHGAAVASWGSDRSVVLDSVFERHFTTGWGGTMLMEENSETEFHRCRFSHGESPYGGHMDDGSFARPLFSECLFEYGRALHGSTYYGYGESAARFVNSVMRFGYAQGSGAAYLTSSVRPVFENVTFLNNTALEGAGLRSYSPGLLLKNCKFIDNYATANGQDAAIQENGGGLILEDCDFEGNRAGTKAGAISLHIEPSSSLSIFRRVRFRNNSAKLGGALALSRSPDGVSGHVLHMEDVLFEGNRAEEAGGAISLTGGAGVTMRNITFRSNHAASHGGAIAINLIDVYPLTVEINDTLLQENEAYGHGGAISCEELSRPSALTLHNVSFLENSAYGDGAGLRFACSQLRLSNTSFRRNVAAGNGGALKLYSQLQCGEETLFENVELLENRAKLGAGVFFSYADPSCAVPTQGPDGAWATSVPSAWRWADFPGAVRGNAATLQGDLQATMPERIELACGKGNCTELGLIGTELGQIEIAGFPGVLLYFTASLRDSFGQIYVDDTLTLELEVSKTLPCVLKGAVKHRFTEGVAAVQSVRVVASEEGAWSPFCSILVRLPLSIYELQKVSTAEVRVAMGNSYLDCPEGHISEKKVKGLWQCKPCPAGTFEALGQCRACGVGTFSMEEGSSSCDDCPVGHGCPRGASIPAACVPGFFQDQRGAQNCLRCPIGSFSSEYGSSLCEACGLGMVTGESGGSSFAACVCAEGKFMVNGTGCADCFSGMICPQGLGEPLQAAGYWAQVLDQQQGEYSVLRCRSTLECPEGPPELCADNREGPACNNCKSTFYPTHEGHCLACGSLDALPVYVLLMFAWLLLAGLMNWVNMDLSQSSLNKLTIAAVANQLCFAIQALSTIRQLQLTWPEPVATLMDLANLITMFDLDFLKIACASQRDHPAVKLLGQLLAIPLLALGVASICILQRALGRRNMPYDHFFNIIGIILFAFSLSLSLAAVMPFQCLPNPNGTSSGARNPGVICYQSTDHWILVIIGICGILAYPVATLSWAVWTTIQYPSRAATGKGLALLYRYRFFFQRFRNKCYGYGLVILIRNFLLALVPVLLVPLPFLQVLVVGLVLLASLVIQVRFWPWRTPYANTVDLLMTGFLIVTLLGVAPLLDVSSTDATAVLGYLLCIPVLAPIVVAFTMVVWSGWRSMGSARKFDIFLCHHKGGAGALARYVKLMLTRQAQCHVFLDADSLESLDQLFDTVRDHTNHFVMLLTQQLLKRMWCAGERLGGRKSEVAGRRMRELSRSAIGIGMVWW